MGRVPLYRQRELPAGFSGKAGPSNIGALTQDIAARGQVGGQFAGQMFQLSEETQLGIQQSQVTRGTLEMMTAFDEVGEKYRNDTDFNTVYERWSKDVLAKKQEIYGKEKYPPRVKEKLDNAFTQMEMSYSGALKDNIAVLEKSHGRAIALEQMNNILLAGGPGALPAGISLLTAEEKAKHFTAEEVSEMKSKLPGQLIFYESIRLAQGGKLDDALENLEKGSKVILLDDIITMRRQVEAAGSAQQQKKAQDADLFSKGMLKQMVDADIAKIDPVSRLALAQSMEQRAADPNNPLSQEQSRVMINWVNNWASPGDVETDWPTFKELRLLVGPVARGEMKFDDAFKAVEKQSKKIGNQEKKELLEKLITASEQKADAPEKDPSSMRVMSTLNDWETRGAFLPTPDKLEKTLPPEQWEAYKKNKAGQETYNKVYSAKRLYELQSAFEKWLKENPTATAEDKGKWLDDIMKLPKTEAAKEWLGVRAWNWLGENPPSVLLGLRKPSEAEPQTGPVKPTKLDLATAKKYLFLAGGNRTRAEAMAKQDGYEW